MTGLLSSVRSDDWAGLTSAPVVVLLLHGYGSDERDLVGLVEHLDLDVPWASVRAGLPVGRGHAWLPITTPGDPDATAVAAATDGLWAWVDAHVAPGSLVVPIGFSQGGLMASQLLRTRPRRVAGAVVLGGFVQGAPQPGDDEIAASRPPVFWGRGEHDQVIAASAVARTAAFLPTHTDLVARTYPGLGHGISADEVADVRAFVGTLVGRPALAQP